MASVKKTKKKKKKKISKGEIVNANNISPLDMLKIPERLFCQAYIEEFGNGTAAYRKAYPKARLATAQVQASRMLNKPMILAGIEFLLSKLWKQKDEDFEKSKIYLLIKSIAETDIDEIIDLEDGELTVKDLRTISRRALKSIKSIKQTKRMNKFGDYDTSIEFTLHDKLKALEILANIQKMINNKSEFDGDIIVIPSEKPAKMIAMEKERDRREAEEENNDDEIIVVEGAGKNVT